MTKKIKELIGGLYLLFVVVVAVMYFSALHYPKTVHVLVFETTSETEVEDEKIHTYYINVGEHNANGCHDYATYPSYSFNTETGEWSDGGNYAIHGNDFCEVNKYGERTRIGFILAVEYGNRLVFNYCYK